jgi:NADPH-dependent ferric siderophore reductase
VPTSETYYRAVVHSVTRLSPSLLRVRLGGGDLAGWVSSGVPDERLVVAFPADGEPAPPAPQRQSDGTFAYSDEETRPHLRSYTVRAWDPEAAELTLEVVRHSGGPAARWAGRAAPGDCVYVTQAMGWYAPPADAVWQLLAGDLTGLPAIGRILESLPAGARAHVIAEVREPADRLELRTAATVTLDWLVGTGNDRGRGALLAALADFPLPPGPGYVWFAGEAADSRGVRKHLHRELGWTTDRYTTLGYWRRDKARWDARYAEIGPGLERVYAEAVAAGRSSTEALELYDDALEQAGL